MKHDQAKIDAMLAKMTARYEDRSRATPEWALLTAPRLGDFARHYQKIRRAS